MEKLPYIKDNLTTSNVMNGNEVGTYDQVYSNHIELTINNSMKFTS